MLLINKVITVSLGESLIVFKHFISLFTLYYIYVLVCLGVWMNACALMWRSENNMLELVFSVLHVGVRDGTQVVALGANTFPQSQLPGPNTPFRT